MELTCKTCRAAIGERAIFDAGAVFHMGSCYRLFLLKKEEVKREDPDENMGDESYYPKEEF